MKKRKGKIKLSRFDQIIEDIKQVEIQGATNIALASIRAFFLKPDKQHAKQILKTRPTEPLMQNAIKFLLKSSNQKIQKYRAEKFRSYLKQSSKKISMHGQKLIKKDMNIFTHCHSSSVINILKQAKKQKKNFIIYTTEVEPLLQGRQTANDLAKAKIKVIVFPDHAASQAIKKCDLLLFGADAFTKKGVVNKIGTSTLCKLAEDHNIPRYSCGISLKYTKKIKLEKRPAKELWNKKDKNISMQNPAFDFVNSKLLTGVVSEFGILSHKNFIKKAKTNLKKFS